MAPNHPYLPPNSLVVAPAALAQMRRLAQEPGEVPAILWAQERSARIPGNGWRELGEGPFVCGERDAPPAMLWRADGLAFVVRLPSAVLDARRHTRLAVGLNGALMLI
jgi:hypothetical protein